MKKKNLIIISCVALALVSLTTATYAYLRTGVMGDISASTGNINLVVNEANANLNEKFNIVLKRSDTEEFVIPGDSGYFDININATGSVDSVDATVTLDRTGLPNNLKFYVDENFTEEYTSKMYTIKKAETMVKTVKVYWYWKDIDDENDSLFIGKTITANASITATIHTPTFSETLIASAYNNLDTNVSFGRGSSTTNGIGLMMRDGTQNDEYPIVYYRGNITNNNVIFADLCWLIVRTTETGGIKLVFNGPVVENTDGTESCTNYSGVGGETANTSYTDVFAGNATTAFNPSSNSPVYVGYMYNDTNKYYDSKTKILDGTSYLVHLSDNTIDNTTGRHTQNLKDSTIKGVVDAWYEANIKGKAEEILLEDTVWCNDRSVISETYTIENMTNGTQTQIHFAAFTRLYENAKKTPSLECSRDMDKFTVESSNGNGDLTYPIGLLTADEIYLAGHPFDSSQTTYLRLTSGGKQWFLSPSSFYASNNNAGLFFLDFDKLSHLAPKGVNGARPSVSLGLGATITGGDGSYQSPYIVG